MREHAARHLADRERACVGDLARLEHDVGLRRRRSRSGSSRRLLPRRSAPCSGARRGSRGLRASCTCRSRRRRPCSRRAGRRPGGWRRRGWLRRARRVKVRPLGWTVTCEGHAGSLGGVMFGILGLVSDDSPDFALKPEPPRRPARALPPRARADRRLRRRRPARRAACCAARWRLLALTSSPERVARACAPPASCRCVGDLDRPATLRPARRPRRRACCTWRRRRRSGAAATRAPRALLRGAGAVAAPARAWSTARPAASTATAAARGSTRPRPLRAGAPPRARRRVDAERALRALRPRRRRRA